MSNLTYSMYVTHFRILVELVFNKNSPTYPHKDTEKFSFAFIFKTYFLALIIITCVSYLVNKFIEVPFRKLTPNLWAPDSKSKIKKK